MATRPPVHSFVEIRPEVEIIRASEEGFGALDFLCIKGHVRSLLTSGNIALTAKFGRNMQLCGTKG